MRCSRLSLQGQALVVAGLATLFSITMGQDLAGSHMLILGASAMTSAAIASVVLGLIMMVVILTSYSLRINPDNVATPIAASLGDLVTLGLLSLMAQFLFGLGGSRLMTDASAGNCSTVNSTCADASHSKGENTFSLKLHDHLSQWLFRQKLNLILTFFPRMYM